MKLIVEARRVEGGEKPFATLFDFARRVDLKRVGKRPLEMLARAGAFDRIDPNRARVFEALDALSAYSAAIHEAKTSNQVSLFGEAGEDVPEPRLGSRDDWLPVERLTEEHKAIGFYLSGHPLDDYMVPLKRKGVSTLTEITAKAQGGAIVAKIAGSVSSKQERKSARGNRFAFIQLSDPTGLYEVTVFSDTLEAARDLLEPGMNVVLTVEATLEGETLKLLARAAQPIDSVAAEAGGSAFRIHIDKAEAVASVAALLARVAKDGGRNRAAVTICVPDQATGQEIDLELPQEYPVTPQVKGALKAMSGVVMVEEL
jgi:DNA polymerase-3 subunit alpha